MATCNRNQAHGGCQNKITSTPNCYGWKSNKLRRRGVTVHLLHSTPAWRIVTTSVKPSYAESHITRQRNAVQLRLWLVALQYAITVLRQRQKQLPAAFKQPPSSSSDYEKATTNAIHVFIAQPFTLFKLLLLHLSILLIS